MRYILAVAVLALSACSDTMGPSFEDTQRDITLSPFAYVSVDVPPNRVNYGADLIIHTRLGIAPVVDLKVSNPAVVSLWPTQQPFLEPDPTCAHPCNKVRWRLTVVYSPERLGEAVITATLRGNPSQQSSFLVRVVP
jgi:hypothetical protein